jgi:universal stress protein A
MAGNFDNFSGIHRVLAAVDASEQAGFAAETAARLCRDLDAELVLVHVVAVPMGTNADMFYDYANIRTECIEEGKDLWADYTRRVESIVHAEPLLAEGDIADAIVRAAKERLCNLIVIGTHGRGRLASAVIGSVAQSVIHKAACPVMCVVHDPNPQHLVPQVATMTADELDDEVDG